MPREVRVSPEVAQLVSDLAPAALRQLVDSATSGEVICAISGRAGPPTAPVSVIAYRDPDSPIPAVYLRCADARLHRSAVVDRPGLREALGSQPEATERGLTWCPFHDQEIAGIAFELEGPGLIGAQESQDPQKVALERRGWVPPVAGVPIPADGQSELKIGRGELVLSLGKDPYVFARSELLAEQWLAIAHERRQVLVLYGCGRAERLYEALRLGDLVGATVPLAVAI